MDMILQLALVFGSVLISITFHEAMHAYTAHWLGDDTAFQAGRLTLNPIKHIDPFATVLLPLLLTVAGLPPFGAAKPVPFNPARLKYDEFGAALVGVSGPLTNLVLAIIAGLWVRFVLPLDAQFAGLLLIFMMVNIGFFVFNLIPFPPLDGSRVLYAFAPDSVRNFMATIERGGLMSIALFIFLLYPVLRPVIFNSMEATARFILGNDLFAFYF